MNRSINAYFIRHASYLVLLVSFIYTIYQVNPLRNDLLMEYYTSCSDSIYFQPAYSQDKDSLSIINAKYSLYGTTLLNASVCKPGILRMKVSGDSVNSTPPELAIYLNSIPILVRRIGKEVTLSVPIKHKGVITIGFMNDNYEAYVRRLYIENITLSKSKCSIENIFKIKSASRIWYYPAANTLEIIDGDEIHFNCPFNSLKFRVRSNSERGGTNSIITIGNAIGSKNYAIKDNPIYIDMENKGGDSYIKFHNPRQILLKDRNLYIQDLNFSTIQKTSEE